MKDIFQTFLYIYNPNYPKSMSQKLFEQLAKERYILYFNGQLVVTNKFYRDFSFPKVQVNQEAEEEIVPVKKAIILPPVMPGQSLAVSVPVPQTPLIKFIQDCQVPAKIKTRDSFYWCNRYSKEAEKELLLILKQGYQYDILVTATKLYYKSGGMPKAISNYLADGVWRGCYQDMVNSLETGTTHELIKNGLDKSDEEGFTKYTR